MKPLQQLLGIVLLVAVIVGSLGYGVGRYVTPPEEITTTTTQVSTSTVTVTERYANTVTYTRTLPQMFPSPANSTAVIRSLYLLDGRVLATLSIDKPVYSQGETVHTKATFTNVAPSNSSLSLLLWSSFVRVGNSSGQTVWTYPESEFIIILGPSLEYNVKLSPGETVTLDHMTAHWNMTGLHRILNSQGRAVNPYKEYDAAPVPAGQYTLNWFTSIQSLNPQDDDEHNNDQIREEIPFTITATKK